MAPVEGIEPPLTVLETAALPLHHTGIVGCGVLDSNQGSSAYEADGMTTSLTRNKTGTDSWERSKDPRLIKTVLYH